VEGPVVKVRRPQKDIKVIEHVSGALGMFLPNTDDKSAGPPKGVAETPK